MEKISRSGETKFNNENCLMKIIEYNNNRDITIEFQDKFKAKIHTRYDKFKNGEIKNPYNKSICGKGCIGVGNYKANIKKEYTIQYNTWRHMLQRCYNKRCQEKNPTYSNCEVCVEWHNFQNFAEWFENNYYTVSNEEMCLDKDILIKGNKIYSPETCIFVPKRINTLFIKSDKRRGQYPVGVYFCNDLNKYKSQISVNKKKQNIGYYTTSEEAFQTYKDAKEDYIKQVAKEYKEIIPQKLYDAMCKYKVSIDD